MADVSYDPNDVSLPSPINLAEWTAGENITAGQPVRLDPTDSTSVLLSQATSAAAAKCIGFAENTASSGQPVTVAKDQNIDFGAVFAVGTTYCISATKAKIAPDADLGSGDFKTTIGIAITTSRLSQQTQEGGVAIP